MIAGIKDWFNHLQGRFSYRQRFVFFGIVYFLFMPPPLYYLLSTTDLFIQSKKIEAKGVEYQQYGGSLLNSILQASLYRFVLMPRHEIYNSEYQFFEKTAESDLNYLSTISNSLAEYKQQQMQKFFSKQFISDSRVDQWKAKWKGIIDKRPSSSQESEKQMISLAEEVSIDIIEKGKALNLYGNSNQIQHLLLYPLLYFLSSSDLTVVRIALGDDHSLDRFNSDSQYLKRKIYAVIPTLIQMFPEHQELFQEYRVETIKCFTAIDNFIEAVKSKNHPDKIALKALQVLKKDSSFRLMIVKELENKISSQLYYYNFLYWFNLCFILAVTLLILLFVILRVITRHLAYLLHHTQQLAQGYFIKCSCSSDKDEFGKVGCAFDTLSNTFEHVSEELQNLSWKLSNATELISKATIEQEVNISGQGDRIKEIETATQKIATDTRHLADTMEKLSAQVAHESLADSVKERLEGLRNKIIEFSNASQSIVGLLEQVEGKMKGMESLIAFMTKVSENANLLSLNAAIETATVSLHRENFGAISDKIQRFANQTVTSTKDIKKLLEVMNSNVANVKAYSISCLKEIGVGADELINFSSQLSGIARQGKDQLNQFQSFNSMMQTQADETEEMIRSITHLRETSQNNTDTIQNVNRILAELCATANELQNILKLLQKAEIA